jgi:hypothetical protein
VFINLASSSFFVVVAYLFYDLIKSYIEKRDSRYAGSIMKCNTWRSRKEPDTLSGYGKTILAFEHR